MASGASRPVWPIAIPLAIGGAFLLGAGISLASTLAFMARTRVVPGTYLDSVAHSGGSHGGTFLYPRFVFRPGPGAAPRVVTSTSGSTDQPYGVGDTVPVRFVPGHPERAVVVSFLTMWVGPFLLGVLGLGFTLPPVLVALGRRRAASPSFSRQQAR